MLEAGTVVDTRRDFIKKAALLAGGAGALGALPDSIEAALAIEPEPGTTYLDAEHVVILMQENRSFDHTYGTLQGVRGFNDPRAIRLPNGNPVWLQSNRAGETYAPFRLDIKGTNATWMGSLPHSWSNQVDARNGGRHDGWLDAKPAGNREYARMPLTLGYYNREDLPFYYAFADAFTVCDQHFCSSLTGTTPNRLYLWTGKLRESDDASMPANVRNEEVDYGVEARWTTFPERLEEHGVSWKIYQNEISAAGLEGEHDAWLTNFTDNPIEWFTQFNVRFSTGHRDYLARRLQALPREIRAAENQLKAQAAGSEAARAEQKNLDDLKQALERTEADARRWSAENFERLPERARNLHQKAFCCNTGDPAYRELSTLAYQDGGTERKLQVPKGDVLHQFREDVKNGALPTVSWLVAPENFSDHPGAAWYGSWYLSEVLEILTSKPEFWKKTVFILTYDENDGYFDHVPPFVAPHPEKPETGRVSPGIDAAVEYVTLEQDLKRKPPAEARGSSIGLGYRVPMVIASPWTRGGCVCSEVFDHTSVLQFLEKLLSHRTGKKIEETNISRWRRTVCGDLTSAFQPYRGEPLTAPPSPNRDTFIEGIHRARFKQPPSGFKKLSAAEIAAARLAPLTSSVLPAQEPGIRRSSPLPYQLYAEGIRDGNQLRLRLEARNEVFGSSAAGFPFNVYAYGGAEGFGFRSHAVAAGDIVHDTWELPPGPYHLEVHGPNGFLREFRGESQEPLLDVVFEYAPARSRKGLSGGLTIRATNGSDRRVTLLVTDNGYGAPVRKHLIRANRWVTLQIDTSSSHGWYDVTLSLEGVEGFARRAAGRVETGKWSFTDPVMGRMTSA